MNLSEWFATPESGIAQILGCIAMLWGFAMYAFHRRGSILLAKLVSDALWVGHYALIGAASGAWINGVNAIREGVFYYKGKRWASHLFWPFLFLFLNLVLTVLSWQGAISLLPVLGSSLNVLGLWCSDTKHLRMVTVPALSAWLTYSALVGSLWGVLVSSASICSAVYALCRDWIAQHRKRT